MKVGKIYLCAGHHSNDTGAIGVNGISEADLTKELRDLIASKLGDSVWLDSDDDYLSQVVMKINSLSRKEDVICDLHFNSFENPSATGCEVIVPNQADDKEISLAQKLSEEISSILGIKNRGVKTEADSHRGSLAMMKPDGINILIEICFISNASDMEAYFSNKEKLASSLAKTLKEFET